MEKRRTSTLSNLGLNNLMALLLLLTALLWNNVDSQSTSTTLAPSPVSATSTTRISSGQSTPTTISPGKLTTSVSSQNSSTSSSSGTGQNISSNSNDITSTEVPIIVHNITQIKVIDTDILKVYFFPTAETLEIEIELNIVKWNNQNKNKNQQQRQLEFHLGFEKPAQPIDFVSVILSNASSTGGISETGSIQDSHWDAKNGQILVDKKQNYKLEKFMRNNSELILMKISRSWLTCDENDVQFSLTNLKLYWNILPMEEKSGVLSANEQEKNNTGDERKVSTLAPRQAIEASSSTRSPIAGTTSTSATTMTTNSLLAGNITSGYSSTSTSSSATAATTTQTPALVKTLKDVFQGPYNVSLNDLLSNFSYLHLQGCGNIFSSKTFECSFLEYQNKSFLTNPSSPLFIVYAIHQPKSARRSTTPASVVVCPKKDLSGRGWGKTNKSLGKSSENFGKRALASSRNIYMTLVASILIYFHLKYVFHY